jgi:hypothetical protein
MTGHDLLRGLPFLGIWVFFGYEWLAVSFEVLHLPSLSTLTYGQLAVFHPLVQLFVAFAAGALILLLVLHLLGLLSWWEP